MTTISPDLRAKLQSAIDDVTIISSHLTGIMEEINAAIPPDQPPTTTYNPTFDPRTQNSRDFSVKDGLVTGAYLAYHQNPSTPFYCSRAKVIPEGDGEGRAGGQVVAKIKVFDRNKQPLSQFVALGIGYRGNQQQYDEIAHKEGSYVEHPIVNAYDPPNLGPLAIFLIHPDNGQIISDVIGSFGLPFGHHIAYEIEFRQR